MPELNSIGAPLPAGNVALSNNSLDTLATAPLSEELTQQSFNNVLSGMLGNFTNTKAEGITATLEQSTTTVTGNEFLMQTPGESLPLLDNNLPPPLPNSELELRSEDLLLNHQIASGNAAIQANQANVDAQLSEFAAFAPIVTMLPTQRGSNAQLTTANGSDNLLLNEDARVGFSASSGFPTQALMRTENAALDTQGNTNLFDSSIIMSAKGGETFKLPETINNAQSFSFQSDSLLNPIPSGVPFAGQNQIQNTSTTLTNLSVQTPVQQPGFMDEMGQRVVWMVRSELQTADIKINPPHLGPIEVHISVNNEQTNITFSTQHALVKEALDFAMPRLRELFADSGLTLTNVNVSQQSLSDQRGHHAGNQSGSSAYSASNSPDTEDMSNVADASPKTGWGIVGMVDLFA